MKTPRSSRTPLLAKGLTVAMPLLLLAGCTMIPALFPVANQHAANWKSTHGVFVMQNGGAATAKTEAGQTCNACHATTAATAKSTGSNAGNSCFTCHPSYPKLKPSGEHAAATWLVDHKTYTHDNGGYNAKQAGITCFQCHGSVKVGVDGKTPSTPYAANSACITCH